MEQVESIKHEVRKANKYNRDMNKAITGQESEESFLEGVAFGLGCVGLNTAILYTSLGFAQA